MLKSIFSMLGRHLLKKSSLKKLFFALSLVSVVQFLLHSRCSFYPVVPTETGAPPPSSYLTNYGVSHWRPGKLKKILMWTTYFRNRFPRWTKDVNRSLQSCPNLLGRCIITDDKSELQSSEAVVFHAYDLWESWFTSMVNSKSWIPQYRDRRQVWVLLTQEASSYMWGWFPSHFFNWTMTYRRDSTILHSYGLHVKKSPWELRKSIQDGGKDAKINHFASKSKMAVVHVSNCIANFRRYKVIRELRKYIEVDEFGQCSGKVVCKSSVPYENSSSRPFKECMDFFRPYKFYLAFENSICRDYISEKYWWAQTVKYQIPVIAASQYTLELLPPHSYLNVFDFSSIKDLADEMIRVGNDESLFNSFFEWQKYYIPLPDGFCALCNALHQNRTAQTYHNLEAWIQHDSCPRFTVSGYIWSYVERKLFDLGIV